MNNKDKWVYWISADKTKIRIVNNRKVVHTLPKDPKKLYELICATTNNKESATSPTQKNNKNSVETFAYELLSEPHDIQEITKNDLDKAKQDINKLMGDMLSKSD